VLLAFVLSAGLDCLVIKDAQLAWFSHNLASKIIFGILIIWQAK